MIQFVRVGKQFLYFKGFNVVINECLSYILNYYFLQKSQSMKHIASWMLYMYKHEAAVKQ